jgi:hypothetical protein
MDDTKDKEPIDANIKSAISALQDAAVLQGAGKGTTFAIFGASSLLEDLIRDALRAEYQRGIGDAHYTDLPDQPAKKVTRAEFAREIMGHAVGCLAAIGVECQVSAHRESAVAAMGGPVIVHLGLAAAVRDPDGMVP